MNSSFCLHTLNLSTKVSTWCPKLSLAKAQPDGDYSTLKITSSYAFFFFVYFQTRSVSASRGWVSLGGRIQFPFHLCIRRGSHSFLLSDLSCSFQLVCTDPQTDLWESVEETTGMEEQNGNSKIKPGGTISSNMVTWPIILFILGAREGTTLSGKALRMIRVCFRGESCFTHILRTIRLTLLPRFSAFPPLSQPPLFQQTISLLHPCFLVFVFHIGSFFFFCLFVFMFFPVEYKNTKVQQQWFKRISTKLRWINIYINKEII